MSSILVRIIVLPIILVNSSAPSSLSSGTFVPANDDLPDGVTYLGLHKYEQDGVNIGMLHLIKQSRSFLHDVEKWFPFVRRLRRLAQPRAEWRSFFKIRTRNGTPVLDLRAFPPSDDARETNLHNFGEALCEALDPAKASRITGTKVGLATTPTQPVQFTADKFDEGSYETVRKVSSTPQLRVQFVDAVELSIHCTEYLQHRQPDFHDPRYYVYRQFHWSILLKRDADHPIHRLEPDVAP
ncbi:hypothetical protein FOZ60_011032 [Perkinsus olseni]|uniref:Uncharacterized protein n=1 Tax=Perkinsus olseni TaxID=32597 RepID=A0A7J6NGG5_PEROL|nr:hypothetical protein FOZ60_011032 [Perkinsus olseni]